MADFFSRACLTGVATALNCFATVPQLSLPSSNPSRSLSSPSLLYNVHSLANSQNGGRFPFFTKSETKTALQGSMRDPYFHRASHAFGFDCFDDESKIISNAAPLTSENSLVLQPKPDRQGNGVQQAPLAQTQATSPQQEAKLTTEKPKTRLAENLLLNMEKPGQPAPERTTIVNEMLNVFKLDSLLCQSPEEAIERVGNCKSFDSAVHKLARAATEPLKVAHFGKVTLDIAVLEPKEQATLMQQIYEQLLLPEPGICYLPKAPGEKPYCVAQKRPDIALRNIKLNADEAFVLGQLYFLKFPTESIKLYLRVKYAEPQQSSGQKTMILATKNALLHHLEGVLKKICYENSGTIAESVNPTRRSRLNRWVLSQLTDRLRALQEFNPYSRLTKPFLTGVKRLF